MRITIEIDDRALPSAKLKEQRWDSRFVERVLSQVGTQQHALDCSPVVLDGLVVARFSIERGHEWQAGITAKQEHHETH